MKRDPRYHTARKLLLTKQLSTFEDLVSIVPLSVLRVDIGLSYEGIKGKLEDPSRLRLDHMIRIAELMETDVKMVTDFFCDLAIAQRKAASIKKTAEDRRRRKS